MSTWYLQDTTGAARRGQQRQSSSASETHSPQPTVKSEPPSMPPRGEEGLLKGDAVLKAIAHREARARARSANGKAPAGPAPESNSRPPVASTLNNLAWISTNRQDPEPASLADIASLASSSLAGAMKRKCLASGTVQAVVLSLLTDVVAQERQVQVQWEAPSSRQQGGIHHQLLVQLRRER